MSEATKTVDDMLEYPHCSCDTCAGTRYLPAVDALRLERDLATLREQLADARRELERYGRLECEAGDTLGGRLDEFERAESAERRAAENEKDAARKVMIGYVQQLGPLCGDKLMPMLTDCEPSDIHDNGRPLYGLYRDNIDHHGHAQTALASESGGRESMSAYETDVAIMGEAEADDLHGKEPSHDRKD